MPPYPDAVKAALRLGAHSIEHGYVMDEECLQLFLEQDAWYVPTLGITHLTPSQATTDRERRYVERRALAPDLCPACRSRRRCPQDVVPASPTLRG